MQGYGANEPGQLLHRRFVWHTATWLKKATLLRQEHEASAPLHSMKDVLRDISKEGLQFMMDFMEYADVTLCLTF